MADKKISELTSATTPLAGTEVLPIVQSTTTKKVAVSDLTAGRVVSVGNLSIPVGTAAAPSIYTSGETTSGIYASASGAVSCSIYGQLIGEFSTSSDFRVFRRGAASQYLVSSVTTAGANIFGSAAVTDVNFGIGTTTYANINSTGGNFTVNTGNVVIGTADKGIDFSANPNPAGMTSELLNDYEEGTWTPTIAGQSSGGTGTYTSQSGRYRKVGNMVQAWFQVGISAHTGTGVIDIEGFPFTSANDSLTQIGTAATLDMTYTAAGVPVIRMTGNSAKANLQTFTEGANWTSQSLATDTVFTIYGSLCYKTA